MLSLLVVALAACQSAGADQATDYGQDDDEGDGGSDPTAPDGRSSFCTDSSQCALAASACCACPTYAANVNDPAVEACDGVTCPSEPDCMDNVRAACDLSANECVLECIEVTCEQTFEGGYQIDGATGCLACRPGGVATVVACDIDTDCVQTRADCCGCANGGEDVAVLAGELASFDAALGCSANPTCPGVNTCEAGATPRCVQGVCVLTTAALPANACGRSDLPACPGGQVCILNRDPQATELGVGVCAPN